MSSYFILGEQVVTGGSTNQAIIMDQLIFKFMDDGSVNNGFESWSIVLIKKHTCCSACLRDVFMKLPQKVSMRNFSPGSDLICCLWDLPNVWKVALTIK